MREKFFYCICAVIVAMSSCKKNASPVPGDAAEKNPLMEREISTWLDKQKYPVEGRHNRKIENLKLNLDFAKLSIEKKDEKEKLVLVPLKPGYETENNKGKNAESSLLLLMNGESRIVKANVMQFQPAKPGQKLMPGSLSKIYTEGKGAGDGKYTVLSLADKFLYELNYKEGRLCSYAAMRSEVKKEMQRGDGKCTDWWLVTTYVYADGHIERDVVFLGQTCGCEMSGPGGATICDELGGDGGGADLDFNYTTIESASGDVTTSIGEQSPDQRDGSLRMSVAWEWKCGKGSTLLLSSIYNWDYYSYETGIVRKNNLNDLWRIHSIQHSSIQLIGQTPPTHVYSIGVAYFLPPQIAPDMRSAQLGMKYVVSETIATKNQTKSWTVHASKVCLAP
jgi:hypothetical protein